jgi:WhiB family redox-sensing transcriptional regulator
MFFPVGASGPALDQISQAKAVCAGCPVADQCLQFAVTTNQEYGVWGGLDEDERRDVRRRWRRELRQQSRAS